MATHVNAFKEDARDKLAKAQTALQEATDAVNALVDRYEQDEIPVETNAEEPKDTVTPKQTPKKK